MFQGPGARLGIRLQHAAGPGATVQRYSERREKVIKSLTQQVFYYFRNFGRDGETLRHAS
jgi:hypothetical protein